MKKRPLSFSMLQIYGLAIFYFTANSVLTVIFPLQAADHGMPEAEIGLMMGMYMFVCMVLRPWAGQLVAKYSALTIMKYLLLKHAAALFICMARGGQPLCCTYFARDRDGVFSMAMQIGITETLRDEDRGQGMAMYSLSTVMPGLYGPALGMLLWVQEDKLWLLVLLPSWHSHHFYFSSNHPCRKQK